MGGLPLLASPRPEDTETHQRPDRRHPAPFDGIGKPESLRENLSGFWSRRIDHSNRLVYAVDAEYLTIISCRYHY